jgi:U6 snRNA-associated Sm-like protein LSm2
MLFFEFYQGLIGKVVTVELKNELKFEGVLESVDQFLNIKLKDLKHKADTPPHLAFLKNAFIRGSVVRYVELPKDIDLNALSDKCRREIAKENEARENPSSK